MGPDELAEMGPAAGLDEIKSKIIAMARQRADGIVGKARAEADSIVSAARGDAEKRLESGRNAYKDEARVRSERRVGTARVEARNRALNAKQELIASVIDEAMAEIAALPDKEYLSLMDQLFLGAGLPEGMCEVHIAASDAKRMNARHLKGVEKKLLAAGRDTKLSLAKEQRFDISGGFIVTSGQMEFDCSLEALFKERRSDLEKEAAQMLFGG